METRKSLQRKLVMLVVSSIGLATVVSTGIGLWQQTLNYAESRRQALVTTAQVFAAAAAQATAAGDEDAAFAALRGMARLADTQYAEIRTTTGRTLAGFGAVARMIDDASLAGDEGLSITRMLRSGTIEVSVPVTNGGVRVGEFRLIGGIADLRGRLLATAAFTAAGSALALLVGLLTAWRLQRRITRPLRGLIDAMTMVRQEKRYDVAVAQASDREIGELVGGFNHMLRDVRERDERLEAHAKNLESEVRARTADLSVARDAAEAANRAKSDFLATMSHEIRTPMNGIMVMADLLVSAELPRRQHRFADVIAKSGKNLLAIINDILDFSKIEAGKLELESLPVDVNALAENVTSLFAERAREKGLDLAAFVDPAVPTIASDPVRLGQVIGNLVNNALKFTQRGGVTLRIHMDGAALRIAVTDTGIGIAQDKLATIFESFSQADQSTTRNFGGTGLGLTISRRLAHALSSDITVESMLGEGSTFSLLLPAGTETARGWPVAPGKPGCLIDVDGAGTRSALAGYFAASGFTEEPGAAPAVIVCDADRLDRHARREGGPLVIVLCPQGDSRADEIIAARKADACLTRPALRGEIEEILKRICAGERNLQPAAAARSETIAALKPFRALVADDNAVNREVAFEALSQLNGAVVSVENGREAVDAAGKERFDIIFMDGSMPVMDGFEAARRIRARETGGAHVPIVALTAHVVGAAAEEWREAGMDAVLHKPFTVAALARTIERLLPDLALAVAAETQAEKPAERPEGAALDAAVLGQLRQLEQKGQTGFLSRVLGLYLEHAPQTLGQIRAAAQAGDPAECARAAHALKSMSLNIGAAPVAALCGEIEGLGKLQNRVPDNAMLADLERAVSGTIGAIAQQPEMAAAPARPETRETALAKACERNELTLHYQPIVDRSGARTVGVEALLRWRHDGKDVSPAEFIPLAEKSGSIHQIGEWVLRRACLDARDWPQVELSVNVSAVQFTAPDLAERIERIVEETGFEFKRLEIEITETAMMTAEESVLRVMRRLKARGVAFALDDFGTGYSSLTYLRRFPIDKIKIDKSFITDIMLAVNATIVHAMTSIGRSLGLKLVAEGVEHQEQQRFLSTAGVHYLQGYLYGRPVPAPAIAERLRGEQAKMAG